ncbi:hypothetical protein EYF80_019835 [Liparis tanakae]|uniref:Uncharacterized protein n=1 Tax=Liparis tanakae TaxID=230148 RepID=A0A4Z2HYE6_9TELE|nr:hypothetical protein EYF80_019835 [Liparis tanakae]
MTAVTWVSLLGQPAGSACWVSLLGQPAGSACWVSCLPDPTPDSADGRRGSLNLLPGDSRPGAVQGTRETMSIENNLKSSHSNVDVFHNHSVMENAALPRPRPAPGGKTNKQSRSVCCGDEVESDAK